MLVLNGFERFSNSETLASKGTVVFQCSSLPAKAELVRAGQAVATTEYENRRS